MAAGRNKALLELAGKPILLHSVETFRPFCDRLLVVSGADDLSAVRELVHDAQVLEGGATRHGSERNALHALRDHLEPEEVVAIHDAARPLVAAADVGAVFSAAQAHGAAMLAAASELPLLEVSGGWVASAYAASELWRAQTPQAAHVAWLLQAYDRAALDGFDGTDTSAVLEHAGFPVHIVPATTPNPKITVRADLLAAERLLLNSLASSGGEG